MKYAPAVELRLSHPFHADGRCTGVGVAPRGDTALLLERRGCLLRRSAGQVTVLSPAGAPGEPLLLVRRPAKSLVFELRAGADELALFTDLTGLLATPSPVFTNARLDPTATGELELLSRTALDPGGEGAAAARRAPGVLAEVEIVLHPPGSGQPSPAVFQITFPPRAWHHAYYCLTDLAAGAGELTIVDTSAAPLSFGAANRTDLTAAPDPADPVGEQLVARFPGMRCVRFVSDEPVACRAEPPGRLELRLDGHRISGPLPSPPLSRFSRRRLPPPGSAPQETLYQIIEYRAQPFSNP